MYDMPFVVGERVGYNHDKVDEPPDATATESDEHEDAGANLTSVEAVNAQ